MPEISRNQEHVYIMKCIYNALVYTEMQKEFSLEELVSGIFECDYEEVPLFSKEVIIKTLSHINEIVPKFQEKMPKWKFSRLNVVEQAILLMSYAHFKYVGDVDKKIIIDIAVKLAKEYLDKDDYKFVNAVLDNVL